MHTFHTNHPLPTDKLNPNEQWYGIVDYACWDNVNGTWNEGAQVIYWEDLFDEHSQTMKTTLLVDFEDGIVWGPYDLRGAARLLHTSEREIERLALSSWREPFVGTALHYRSPKEYHKVPLIRQ